MSNKNKLQQAIEDIKEIKTGYERKADHSPILAEMLKDLELDLLGQFYDLMNKPVAKRPRVKKQKNKTVNEISSAIAQT